MVFLNKTGFLFVSLLLFSFVSLGDAVCGSCPATLTNAPPNGQVLTVQCNNIPAEPVVTYPDGGCSSGSILVVLQETRTLGSCPSQYTINRLWRTFNPNACGQTITSSQTIIVQDSTQPTVNKPADITITCDQLTDPSVTGQATGDDNCVATLFTLNFNPGDPSNCDRTCQQQGNLVFVSPVDSSYTLTLLDDRSNGGFGGLASGVHITNENYGNQKVGSSTDFVLGAYNIYASPGLNYHSSGVVGILNKPAKRVRIDDTDDDATTKTLWALNSGGTIKAQDGPGSRRTFSAQSSVVDVVRFEFDTILGTGGGSTDGTYFTVDNLVVEGALITVSSSDTVTSTNWCNRQISRTWISTDACGNVSPGSVQRITIVPPPCGSTYPGLPFSWVADSGVTTGTACSGASISLTKRFQDTTTCTSGQLVVTVDWAEGNGLVTVPGAGTIDTSTATGSINLAHSYNSAGDRTITVCVRVGSGSNYCTTHLIRVNNVGRLLAPLEWLMYVPQTITWDQIDSAFNGQQVTVSIKNIGSNASSANLRVLDTVSIGAGGLRVKGLSKILPGSYSLFATVQNGCIMTPVDFKITVPGV